MSALLLSTDLMITSQATGAAQRAGCPLAAVSNAAQLLERLSTEPAGLVIIDLASAKVDLPNLVEQLRAIPSAPKIVAFGPHVHADKLKAAHDAGCDNVLSRGQFHAQAEAIFRQACD
jgi:CheY-like chemotaxis protein